MKTLTTLSIAILLSLLAMAQDYELIPLNEITKIANRNAEALWGDCHPAEPIPYFGQDGEIIAWRFNYAVGNDFPNQAMLKNQCHALAAEGNADKQWGVGEYGRILVSARSNMPVILEHSGMLSPEYSMSMKFDKLKAEAFGIDSPEIVKHWYLGQFDIWCEMSNGNTTKYICVSPTGGIVDDAGFLDLKKNKKMFCKTGDFSLEWANYKNGFVPDTKGDVLVPYYTYMPFIDWSYGCSPTAAMMILAYYDYRSMVTTSKYPLMVSNIFQRNDIVTGGMSYTVCGTHRQLAIQMNTDTIEEGMTYMWNVDNGMQAVTNGSLGYNFDIYNKYSTPWTRLKDEIDAGRPAISNSYNEEHSFTAVGYNNSTDKIIVHDTWGPALSWVDKTNADVITIVKPGGSKGNAIDLVHPKGDTRYNRTGQGEDFYAGDVDEIRWTTDCYGEGWVKIYLSTDGGHSWDEIAETENDHCYDWEIPSDIDSEECRILIWLIRDTDTQEVVGADGSISNFKIHPGGAVPTMSSNTKYTCNDISRYFYLEHHEPSWAVIGNHTVASGQYWETQIFPNEAFNQSPLISSVCAKPTNFIVIDGNHAPDIVRGVKAQMALGDTTNYIMYEGGNNELTLTPGATQQINWGENALVKMYDVHLTPGQYYFRAIRSSGSLNVDIDIAFFSSNDGQYFKSILEADYISENLGGLEDSFIVDVSAEGDYGFCMFAKTMGAGSIELKIDDAFIWTGTEDSNWHNGDNWVGGIVPTPSSKVAIPDRANDPVISSADAYCSQLNLLRGARLTITANDLQIGGDFYINGSIYVLSPSPIILCTGDVTVASYAYIELNNAASIWVYGDWTFGEGSNPHFDGGTVKFKGTSNSIIYVKSENAWFKNLTINKTGGAFVAYDNCPDMEPLIIKGQFVIENNATFIQYAMYNTIFEGPFLAYPGSHFAFTNGNAIFDYAGTGGITIYSEPGSYFNNLTASCADWLGLSSDIEIRGDLTIEEGNFKTLGYDVYIKGDWNDEAWGFNHGSSRVIFNGSGIQTSYGGAFWELELNKTSGELRIRENTTSAQHYDWTQGTMRVNGGCFLANDLVDAGIYGTLIITSGTADFRQDAAQYFDMNANLEISGGELHLHGGNGMGFWPFSHDASITMSDGLIDIHDNGIKIYNSATYNLTENITGGLIRINGSLHIHRDDFNPTGGTIQLIGYEEDASLHSVEGANFFNLVVDKSSKKNKALAANLVATGFIDINGDFMLDGGNFEAPETMEIYGQFINNQTPEHFDELTGTVVFDGPEDNVLDEDEVFFDLTIKKPSDYFIISENVSLGVNGAFTIDEGTAYFLPGSEITVGESLSVNSGGVLALEGTAIDRVSVNHGTSKLNYSFDVNPGGTIGAVYTTFIYMDLEGLNLHSGAYVMPEGAFHNCNFAYGPSGGTLMTIDNGADLVIHEANFLPNTTGMAHNVSKNVDNGNVYFDEAIGDFSGAAFENDPFNRIQWEYIPPFEMPFNEDWSSGDFATNIWTSTGANWMIDNSYGNDLPSAEFGFSPVASNYFIQLRSYSLNGLPHEEIVLSYDIAFEKYTLGTLEQMSVRVVYPNGNFYTVANYTNSSGSFEFISEEIDISEYAAGEIFSISFMAHGEDSWNIEKWNIDNIEVSGVEPFLGKLTGCVKEEISGNPIESAFVEITGTSFDTLTDEYGEFSILDIPPGIYSVRISAEGFETKILNGVEIKPDEGTNIAVALSLLPPSYCIESLYVYGCSAGDGIETFILKDIINEASGCSTGGYGNFTALSTALSRGYSYPIQLSSNYTDQRVSVWVDFDNDFEFDESERLITDFIIQTQYELYTAILNIPETAPSGSHRLRIRTNWNDACTQPCAQYYYGEVEDYTVIISDSTETGSLELFVVNINTQEPVENARAEIMGTGLYGYTEEEGFCHIQHIEAGSCDIQITARGFESNIMLNQYIFPDQMLVLEVILTPTLPEIQTIELTQGWQGLSSFLMPANSSIPDIFSAIADDLILVYNYEEVYWPGAGVSTLTNWEQHDGFIIKMANDATLEIAGFRETQMSCQLSQGWSLLPVVCSENISLQELLDGTTALEKLVLIKEIAGTGIFWPEYSIHSLEVLETGKAYQLLMAQSDVLVFPEMPAKLANVAKNFEYPNTGKSYVPAKTASSHIVMFPETALNPLDVDENCWIAAFTNEGLCCGMAPLNGNTSLTIFGDDPASFEKEGFEQGGQLNFSIINTKTLQAQKLCVEFENDLPNHDGKFADNGLSVAKSVGLSTNGIAGNLAKTVSVYPNPTRGAITFDGLNSEAQIILFEAGGQQLLQKIILPGQPTINLKGFEKGVYLLKIITPGQTYTQRIVLF